MKNVTISMSEELARWLRVEAAEADVSISRYLADLVSIIDDGRKKILNLPSS